MSTTAAEALKERGNNFFRNGRLNEALDQYSRAIELDPANATYYANRAACLMQIKDFNGALADSSKAVELNPKYAKAWARQAAAQKELRDTYNAAKSWKKATEALDLDPSQVENAAELKEIYSRELKEAHQELEKEAAKPRVLVLLLEDPEMYQSLWRELRSAISKQASVVEATDARTAIQHLSGGGRRPSVVISADSGIMNTPHPELTAKLVEYAKSGGTLVLGGLFSSCMKWNGFDSFISQFGLEWKFTNYTKVEYEKNDSFTPGGPMTHAGLSRVPKPPYQKAVTLRNVRPDGLVYIPEEDEDVDDSDDDFRQSEHYAAARAQRLTEGPVAFEEVGDGYVGWVGFVNPNEGATELTLAICGLDPDLSVQ